MPEAACEGRSRSRRPLCSEAAAEPRSRAAHHLPRVRPAAEVPGGEKARTGPEPRGTGRKCPGDRKCPADVSQKKGLPVDGAGARGILEAPGSAAGLSHLRSTSC